MYVVYGIHLSIPYAATVFVTPPLDYRQACPGVWLVPAGMVEAAKILHTEKELVLKALGKQLTRRPSLIVRIATDLYRDHVQKARQIDG